MFVVNAVMGVEVSTQRLWQRAQELGVARLVYVNMLDRERADFFRALDALKDAFGPHVVATEIPIGSEHEIRGLIDLVDMKAISMPGRLLFARNNRFFTVGLLPPELRAQMGYEWTDADERRLDRTLRRIGSVYRYLPPLLRAFPLNWCLWDMRRRVRNGRPLV